MGYHGAMNRTCESENIPLKIWSPEEMWNKIMKEVKERQYAGPYERPPFPYYLQSPIGLVPKAGNKTRLIFHLPFDFGTNVFDKSFNFHTPKDLCTIHYNDLDCAVWNSLFYLQQTGYTQLFYTKSDCSNAFRILPGKVSQHCLLTMKMRHPMMQKLGYFIDKCMPFGASISCANFQAFLHALKYIMEWQVKMVYQIYIPITNYLDDFLFLAISILLCNGSVKIFLRICEKIGCPISMEKTKWATQILVFLGILLNGRSLTLSIPLEKKNKALNLLNTAIDKRKVTIKFMQKLTGTLNFLNRVIVPGRAFT